MINEYMLIDIKNFWLTDTDNESILEKDIIDAYNYSVKNNCIVIIYSYATGPRPSIFIQDNTFRLNNSIGNTKITNIIKVIVSKIKGSKTTQYNWFD